MSTLKIIIPDGFKIGSFDESTGEVKFVPKPKKVTERIKTFDDVLKELNITTADFYADTVNLSTDEIAYVQIKAIAKSLNEGWEPDWANSSQYKYYPWFRMNASAVGGFSFDVFDNVISRSSVGSRLCFKSSELARYAGETFTEIYKQFMLK